MSEAQGGGRTRSGTFLIVLATIGGLALTTMVAFFTLIFWVSRGGVSTPSVIPGDRIGVVQVKGVIAEPEGALKALRAFGRNDDVKAVVVRIDSPGGAVGASQELYEEIRRLDGEKPVVASLVTVAASGGYYAAVGARHIVSNPGTVTGSIGVIMKIPNVASLLEKLGIRTTVVKSGALKDLGSVTRDLTAEEVDVLEEVLVDVHRQFIQAISESREMPEGEVEPLADGRIFSGRQALDAGLVDELGNLSVAVERAASLAGLSGEPTLVYPQRDRLSILKELLGEAPEGLVRFVEGLVASPAQTPVSY
jgi:protease-4